MPNNYLLLHNAIDSIYEIDNTLALAGGDTPSLTPDIWEQFIQLIFAAQGFSVEDLASAEAMALINATYDILAKPIASIEKKVPATLIEKLRRDVWTFSGWKTFHEAREAVVMLTDEDGNLKTFSQFKKDVKAVDEEYNVNYLRAEYNFATNAALSAEKWESFDDDYLLQYRTAGDERVRKTHEALNGITLPKSDSFWKKYFPPNDWGCRCTTVQVRKNKYSETDHDKAMEAGERATTRINKKGQNKAAIFRFNPAVDGRIFPHRHPYYKGSKEVKETIEKLTDEQFKR